VKSSIIITSFNCATYLAAAIRSALHQTYPEKEIIDIDDESTDESVAVIREFGPYIIKWETGAESGR
jgi:glycosyltransferase involved in cell wall biosynthesis